MEMEAGVLEFRNRLWHKFYSKQMLVQVRTIIKFENGGTNLDRYKSHAKLETCSEFVVLRLLSVNNMENTNICVMSSTISTEHNINFWRVWATPRTPRQGREKKKRKKKQNKKRERNNRSQPLLRERARTPKEKRQVGGGVRKLRTPSFLYTSVAFTRTAIHTEALQTSLVHLKIGILMWGDDEARDKISEQSVEKRRKCEISRLGYRRLHTPRVDLGMDFTQGRVDQISPVDHSTRPVWNLPWHPHAPCGFVWAVFEAFFRNV
ncbi:hypothetical protein LXL04_010579 [Taraxacum kok-saghyz]